MEQTATMSINLAQDSSNENQDPRSVRLVAGLPDTSETEPPSKRRRTSFRTPEQQLREFGLMRTGPGETSGSFIGSASGIYFIQSVYGALAAERASQRPITTQTPESEVVPGEDDQLPGGAADNFLGGLWRPDEVVSSSQLGNQGQFSFEDLIEWTKSYFDHWHAAYPFIHAPSLLEYFEHVAQQGIASNDPRPSFQLTILRSIMSISLADQRQSGVPLARLMPSILVFESFTEAMNSIQRMLTDPTSIQSLQAAVSVQLFLVSMLRYNAASRLGGCIVRMAFQLGLHRCPLRFRGFSAQEAALRQRLFWSVYCLDRYICQSLGLPLGIRDDDIDVCFPGREQHSLGTKSASNLDDRLFLLDFLAKHAEIRGSIMEIRNKSVLHSQLQSDQAVVIAAELTKWWNEVDEFLDMNGSETSKIDPFHQMTLTVIWHEAVIALNRPILATPKKSSGYKAALQNCINASRSVITILHKTLKTGTFNGGSSQHQTGERMPLLWPSFTWAVWMSAFIIIYAANENELPRETAIRLTDRSSEILKHLSLRGSIWPETCAVAIRDLCAQLSRPPNKSNHPNSNEPSRILGHSGYNTPGGFSSHHELRKDPSRSTPTSQRINTSSHGSYQQNSTVGNEGGESTYRSTQTPIVPSSHTEGHYPTEQSGFQEDILGPESSQQPSWFSNLTQIADSQLNLHDLGQRDFNETLPDLEETNIFYGFDIPFWMGDDQFRRLGNGML